MAAQPGLKRVLSWVPVALSARTMKVVKGAVFVGSLYELVRLACLAFANDLGANPVELIERGLGTAALVMLLLTLAISPLRWLTGWAWLLRLRRMLGLYAFFYAVLHVIAYVWLDHWFDWQAVWLDIVPISRSVRQRLC
ncbi:MAG: ferric reductase-like transmembrane domain-containing protein [Burkholderiaceae bacterium]